MIQPRRQQREGRDHASEDIFFVEVDRSPMLKKAGYPRGAVVAMTPFNDDLREGRSYVVHSDKDAWVAKCVRGPGGLYVGGNGRPAAVTKILARIENVQIDHAPVSQVTDRASVSLVR